MTKNAVEEAIYQLTNSIPPLTRPLPINDLFKIISRRAKVPLSIRAVMSESRPQWRFTMVGRYDWKYLRGFLALALALFCVSGQVEADTVRTQSIALKTGWNAIWLEVDPANDAVAAVFDPAQVDVVARYFTPMTQVRFIEDPSEQAWNTPGWGVWYAPSRAEAFLTSLHAIRGNCAYLVHATSNVTLTISGTVHYRPLRWNSDSYNLTGLPVSETQSPTFQRFFSGAGGRVGAQVYRLVEGSWQKVTNHSTETIRSGEAYWIYCEGKTNYQGPLELRFTGGDGLNLGNGSTTSFVELANRATSAFSVHASVEPGGNLPLFRSVPDLKNLSAKSEPLSGNTHLGTLGIGGVSQLRLEFRPALSAGSGGSALLKLSTSDGIVLRVPVRVSLP